MGVLFRIPQQYPLLVGSQSAAKADPGQKKGPGTTVGLGGPPGAENPEQEGGGARDSEVITQEHPHLITAAPTSQTPPLPSDSPSHSLGKEGDTNSISEDTTTFVSCLTEVVGSPTENTPPPQTSNGHKNNDSTLNSASDTVTQISSHDNGANKDSEYESAEEVDLPLDTHPSTVTDSTNFAVVNQEQTVSSENSAVTEGSSNSESTGGEVIDSSTLVEEKPCDIQATPQQEVSPASEIPNAENPGAKNEINDQNPPSLNQGSESVPQEQSENLPTLISESLVTVSKSEVIEDSVSAKEVLIDETVIVSPRDIQLEEKVSEVQSDSQTEKQSEEKDSEVVQSESRVDKQLEEKVSEVVQSEEKVSEGVQSDSQINNTAENTESIKTDPEDIHSSVCEPKDQNESCNSNDNLENNCTPESKAREVESTPVTEPDIPIAENIPEIKVEAENIPEVNPELPDQTQSIQETKLEEPFSPQGSDIKVEDTVPVDQTDSAPEIKVEEVISPESNVKETEEKNEKSQEVESSKNKEHLSEVSVAAEPIKEESAFNSSLLSESASVPPKEPEAEGIGDREVNQEHIDQPSISQDTTVESKQEQKQTVIQETVPNWEDERPIKPATEPNQEAVPNWEDERSIQPAAGPNQEAVPNWEDERPIKPATEANQEAVPNWEDERPIKPATEPNQEAVPNWEDERPIKPATEPNQEAVPNLEDERPIKPAAEPNQEAVPNWEDERPIKPATEPNWEDERPIKPATEPNQENERPIKPATEPKEGESVSNWEDDRPIKPATEPNFEDERPIKPATELYQEAVPNWEDERPIKPASEPEQVEERPIQVTEPKREEERPIEVAEPNREEDRPIQVAEPKEDETPIQVADPDDIPIPKSKGYNLDFLDNLDDPNFNPFATKTGVRSSPPPTPDPSCKLPPLKPAVRKKDKKTKAAQGPKAPEEETVNNNQKLEDKGKQESSPPPDNNKVSNNNEINQPLDTRTPGENTDNSFEIVADDPVKPPRKPVKRPDPRAKRKPVNKSTSVPKVEKNNNTVEGEKDKTKTEEEEVPIPPSKGYNLDFLDNLEDPNFNPFTTKTAVRNSPPKEGFTTSNLEEEEKPKAKVVTAKKAPPKKGFTALKSKKPRVPDSNNTKNSETTPKQVEDNSVNKDNEEDSVVVPKKGYNLDFLDDPNFDPFQTRSAAEPQKASSPKPSSQEDSNSTASSQEDSKPPASSQEDSKPIVGSEEVSESKGDTPKVEEHIPSSTTEPKEEQEPHTPNKNKDNDKDSGIYQDLPTNTSSVDECSLETEGEQFEQPPSESNNNIKDNTQVNSESSHDVTDSSEVQKLPDTEHILRGERQAEGKESEVEKVSVSIVENHQSETPPKSEENQNQVDDTDPSADKTPSIGHIGQLDSLEFDQLLGHEASRLAEEFMNCSTDSGLPDSDESTPVKSAIMADTTYSNNNNLDENVNPFQRSSKLARSPPLGKRGVVCGAESSETTTSRPRSKTDSFLSRRPVKREIVMGEERMDTASSLDDDSGIVVRSLSDLETDANHSEAGPEIATGLTTSDLLCASQLKTDDQEEGLSDHITDEEFRASEAFFKEATDMESQFRRTLVSPLLGSHSKLSSSEEGTPTKERKEPCASVTPESPQNKPVPSTSSPARPTSSPAPPREERSAPEGTSSPTPRPTDTSERKLNSTRPTSAPPEGYMTASEVQKLLKQQELKFEEKLLQVELAAGEKEKKLHQAMKDEQKELTNLGSSVSELTQSRDALLKMVTQYKGMLASLLSEKEKEKQSYDEKVKTIETERNQALDDLANVEVAFSDVHRKYERTKQVVDTLRRNEDTLRNAVADYEAKLQKQEQKFLEFQKHAEEKIQQANEEFENMRKSNEQEMTKMAALLKKAEMKIMSLQDGFDRKTRENQELTQLCDDLINKVGK